MSRSPAAMVGTKEKRVTTAGTVAWRVGVAGWFGAGPTAAARAWTAAVGGAVAAGLREDEEKADPTVARAAAMREAAALEEGGTEEEGEAAGPAGTREGDGEAGSILDYIRCWYRPKLYLNLIRPCLRVAHNLNLHRSNRSVRFLQV